MVLAVLLMFGSTFAYQNDATGDMLQARYEYVKCDVDYAKGWLSMRENCGDEFVNGWQRVAPFRVTIKVQ